MQNRIYVVNGASLTDDTGSRRNVAPGARATTRRLKCSIAVPIGA